MPFCARLLYFFDDTKKPLKSRKNRANSSKIWQRKVRKNYVKSIIHLPRQCLRGRAKALILLGFLEEEAEFTPYLHLWKTGSAFKTYANYKRHVLKIRN